MYRETCCSALLLKPMTLFEKETPTQVFSCEYYEIFGNNSFYRTRLVDASENCFSPQLTPQYSYLYRNGRIHCQYFRNERFIEKIQILQSS